MTGTLYIVSTPIGNLEDITLRALRVLREAAVVAAEDTRRTVGLLNHFGIRTPTLSLHEHNEHDRIALLLSRLERGEDVAVVTDAGTPLVSDPGAATVAAARAAGFRVEAVPGASALLAALVSCGIPTDTFAFLGFSPNKASARAAWLRALASEPRTCVFFEAPHRILQTLGELAGIIPTRAVAVGRELTKLHEQIIVGTAASVVGQITETRGEFTIVVGPPDMAEDAAAAVPAAADLWREFCTITATGATTRREAVTSLARRYGRPAREIYQLLEQGRTADSADPGSNPASR